MITWVRGFSIFLICLSFVHFAQAAQGADDDKARLQCVTDLINQTMQESKWKLPVKIENVAVDNGWYNTFSKFMIWYKFSTETSDHKVFTGYILMDETTFRRKPDSEGMGTAGYECNRPSTNSYLEWFILNDDQGHGIFGKTAVNLGL